MTVLCCRNADMLTNVCLCVQGVSLAQQLLDGAGAVGEGGKISASASAPILATAR